MKKINFLFLMLLGFLAIQAQVTAPVEGVKYSIQHYSGFYLGSKPDGVMGDDNNNAVIQNYLQNNRHAYYFEPVSGENGNYYIKEVDPGWYLMYNAHISGNTWRTGWVMDPNDALNASGVSTPNNCKFQIVATGTSDYVMIKNVGRGSNLGLGTDATAEGSDVYSDKNGTNTNHWWKIIEFSMEADKSVLAATIADAQQTLATTTVGTNPDEYPADTRAVLEEILDAALWSYDNDNEQFYVNQSVSDLQTALDAYRNSVHPFLPADNTVYNIVHDSTGLYLGTLNYYAKIQTSNYSENQQFKIIVISPDDGTINIQQVQTGYYLGRNSYNTVIGNVDGKDVDGNTIPVVDPDSLYAQFVIRKVFGNLYKIQGLYDPWQAGKGTCLGTDTGKDGDAVYADKQGNAKLQYWRIIPVSNEVKKDVLEGLLNTAKNLLDNAKIGNGSNEYPQNTYDALLNSYNTAKDIYDNSNSQTDVNNAATQLSTDIANFKASINNFLPATDDMYYIIHSSGFYLSTDPDDNNSVKIMAPDESDLQKFIFVQVSGTTDVYNIQQVASGLFLSRMGLDPWPSDNWTTILSEDPSSDLAKYTMTQVSPGLYKIKNIAGAADATNRYLGTDANTVNSPVYSDKTGNDGKHYWGIVSTTANSIKQQNVDNLFVYVSGGILYVNNLTGKNVVSIYSLSGQLLSTAKTGNAQFNCSLPAGNYILTVRGDNNYSKIVVLK